MNIQEKYNKWLEIYNKYFYTISTNIPLEKVDFDSKKGYVGDGTINISDYLTYLYIIGNDFEINKVLNTVNKLSTDCFKWYQSRFPEVYFKEEPGFFFRDNLKSTDAWKYSLKELEGSYSRGVDRINEDPCHSTFVSQDQIWHLIPPLSVINNPLAKQIGYNITEFVVRNKHIIYNPYYSAVLHDWTYVPTFDTNKVPAWERVNDRNKNLKYTVKVKRGANNWYFSYGFKKAFNLFGGNSKTFWSSLWYKPFIFLADKIYHPYICKWFNIEVKNISYYSLGIAADAWYDFSNVHKRIVNKFNNSLKEGNVFLPTVTVLSKYKNNIDKDLLDNWLNNYPEPKEEGIVESPINFLTLYAYRYLSKNSN